VTRAESRSVEAARGGIACALRAVCAAAALLVAPACTPSCEPPPPVTGDPAGTITTRPVQGGFELVLGALARPLTAVQVDVEVTGARAVRIVAAGAVAHDVLEAGLDQPKASFTAVVSDVRRLPLVEGAIAKIETDAPNSEVAPRLTEAVAVDETGARRTLNVVVQ
jgi:hypothetical protein